MSRSYKKTPIYGNAGDSEKKDKRLANRKFRKIKPTLENEDELPIDLDEVMNKSSISKNGKHYSKEYYDADPRNKSK
jgi:hypothetical protein